DRRGVPGEPHLVRRERDPRVVAPDVEEPVEARAVEDRVVDLDRVLAGDEHDEAAGEERDHDGDERRDGAGQPPEPRREVLLRLRRPARRRRLLELLGQQLVAHAASAPPRRPPVIAKPSSSSVALGGNSPTIRPSYMTRIRSESDRISSSSSDTSRTARPASRCSTSLRWTNSIAPTSRPRVGCAAISIFGSPSISRARTTFCWLPPERAYAGVVGVPPRTSNTCSSRRARASMAPGLRKPRREFGGTR